MNAVMNAMRDGKVAVIVTQTHAVTMLKAIQKFVAIKASVLQRKLKTFPLLVIVTILSHLPGT